MIAEHWVTSQQKMLTMSSAKGLLPSPKAYGIIIFAASKKNLKELFDERFL